MKRTGIILAAGEATRLPNKPLLPIRNGKIAIESAIDFLKVAEVDKTIVVVQPESLIADVLAMRGHTGLKYVVQPFPHGVGDAIAHAAPHVADHAILTFSDNVYQPTEGFYVPDPGKEVMASIRCVSEEQKKHLDGWDGKKWISRSRPYQYALAGWCAIPRNLLWHITSPFIAWLESQQAVGVYATFSWWDIGTPASYATYLKGD